MTDREGENFRDIPPLSEPELETTKDSGDAQSTSEAKQLASGRDVRDLKREADENEADRVENFRDHFEGLAIVSLYLVWLGLVVFGFIWAYHMVAAPNWPQLPPEQIGHMQSILAGGVIGIATGHIKRRLSN